MSVVVPTYVMVPTAVAVMMTVGGMVLRVSLLLITGGGLAVSVAEEGCLSLLLIAAGMCVTPQARV